MIEKRLRKRLTNVTIAVIILSVVILMGGSFFSSSINSMAHDAMTNQMRLETKEYKNNIQNLKNAELQTLNTLSSFLEFGEMIDATAFSNGLYHSTSHNQFIQMGFFNQKEMGVYVDLDSLNNYVALTTMPEDLQAVIRRSLAGQEEISDFYYDPVLEETVFAYSVPVNRNGTIIGALFGVENISEIYAILDDTSFFNGQGNIYLIDQEGNFLIQSKTPMIQEQFNSVFDKDYISDENETTIKTALNMNEEVFSTMTYKNADYQIFFEPVEIQNWYLFSVNTAKTINESFHQIYLITRWSFILVLTIVILFILYGYQLLRKNSQRLIRAAYYDAFTGAYNTTRFNEKLEVTLEKTNNCCVIAFNIHAFKFINEIFGHEQANQLLLKIKEILDTHMQPGEYFCRDSADLFYILLLEEDRDIVKQRLEHILQEIIEDNMEKHPNYQITFYCGIAFKKNDVDQSTNRSTIMTHVMFALNKARTLPQNAIWFYDTELHKIETLDNYIESHMRQALQKEEFKLYLQPKVDLETNRLAGAEALVRWELEDGRILYPNHFIPLFEENGFCVDLDFYMLEKVCQQIRHWIDEGITPIPISINQSKLVFYDPHYIDRLIDIVSRYDVPPHLITLEILERMALEKTDELEKCFEVIRAKGIKISMDDFGTGYSSLNSLARLTIDELKIDRGFLLEAAKGEGKQKVILEKIVELTKSFSMKTVIEGVETSKHDAFAKELHCDYGQGYYYNKPLAAKDFDTIYMRKKDD